MFKIIFLILIIVVIGIGLYILYITRKTKKLLLDSFKKSSVIVYGKKGAGKDLVFQKIIAWNKKEPYLSNINYGYNYINAPLKDLSVEPNIFTNFIDGDITKIEKKEEYEGKNYYLSDGGIYIPSQYDFYLHKKYKSLPVFYAISRHLYNMNIHINTQNLERIWKAAREQADIYIKCIQTYKFMGLLITKICVYDRYESALNSLLPMRKLLMNKDNKARVEQYNATHGLIQQGLIIQKIKSLKYDTRIYHEIVFGRKYEKTKA